MNRTRVWAVIRKDVREVTAQTAVVIPMIAVPAMLCVVIPVVITVLTLTLDTLFVQGEELIERLIPRYAVPEDLEGMSLRMLYVFLNYSFVPLFIIVPLMVSSIIAANSVVGEKERSTLETLLYTPLTNRELLFSKLLAAFLPAMVIGLLSFVVFFLATNLTSYLMAGLTIVREPLWIAVLLLLVPTVSAVGLSFTLLVSVRAKSYMEAQQLSGIIVLPVVALLLVQLTGVLVLNLIAVVVIAVVLLAGAYLLLSVAARKLQRERLIQLL